VGYLNLQVWYDLEYWKILKSDWPTGQQDRTRLDALPQLLWACVDAMPLWPWSPRAPRGRSTPVPLAFFPCAGFTEKQISKASPPHFPLYSALAPCSEWPLTKAFPQALYLTASFRTGCHRALSARAATPQVPPRPLARASPITSSKQWH
jgi:hypothetical protein